MTSWDTGPVESVISEQLTFRRSLASKAGVDVNTIPMVCLLNWTAPSLIKADIQDMQINVTQWALTDNLESCRLVLCPAFACRRGTLRIEESLTTTLLTTGNHNIGVQFSLLFQDSCDDRDLRPLNYPSLGDSLYPHRCQQNTLLVELFEEDKEDRTCATSSTERT